MIIFKISLIDRLVTITVDGIEKPFLKIEIPMPLYNEDDIQFYKITDGELAFNVVRTSEDDVKEDEAVIIEAFKNWYGNLWNDNIYNIEYFDN
jgi:hypothetical protein